MEEISLQELFGIIKKRLWMIILLTVISVVLAGVLSYFVLKPEYETFTTLMLGKSKDHQLESGIDYDDLLLNQRLVRTYGELVKSRDVSDKVIEDLDLDIDFKTFSDKVSVKLVDDTEIIKIEVKDKDPVMAARIANETATIFMDSVTRFMNVENVQVIDKAQAPEGPVKPRPTLNMAIAGVLGIMVGVFITFLLEFLDNTIKGPGDVEKYLEISNIGSIPKVDNNKVRLISLTDPKSPITEAFRTLRTNIQFSNIDNNLETILITSSGLSEGKSSVASNIAGTIAQDNKRVLLIDCDLRKPRIHEIFRIRNLEGLTNILVGDKKPEDISYKYPDLDNLHIITAGPIPPNPAELLGSKRMEEFIREVKKEYDMVILDTPPVGLVTDSAVLSRLVDGVILVATVGQTDIETVIRGKELLDKVEANIIGAVLNKVPIENKSYYGYYGEDMNRKLKGERAR